MTKRFVIATEPLTTDEEKRLKDAFDKAIWWHWLPNFWLVKDSNEILTTTIINDSIHLINDKTQAIVIEVKDVTWSTLSKEDSEGREMTAWIRAHWDTD